MSGEAFRLTSATPAEAFEIMGPCGVDSLIREGLQAVWLALPKEIRTYEKWKDVARSVFNRNIAVWARIKKPSPQNFFEDLIPEAADGSIRQAMVVCWMMTPMGKRVFINVKKVVLQIFERNMQAWKQDNDTFKSTIKRTIPKAFKAAAKAKTKAPVAKKPAAKSKAKPKRKK